MKKSDVERSYHRGHSGDPMVNVKVYGSVDPRLIAKVCEEEQYGADAAEYLTDLWARDEWPEWTFDAACESGWENLKDNAEYAFPDHEVKVWSAGGSGGWCVVHGLDDVESWDAIMLGKWRQFAKWARALADDIPAAQVRLALYNAWEQERDERERAAKREMEQARLLDIAFSFAV